MQVKSMQKNGRMPFIGHGYTSMPHSFKHGYGNPYRRQRMEMARHFGYWPHYWYY
ncbi:hypothetical protein CHCC14809_0392 [Bacillus licheniformis]|nr:hypothetical protein B4091_2906 [Bacillus licheniformis]TWN15834.1 hypothetical protein CHCC14564_0399 [Bacillus licheniformis LMG 17339]TDO61578.1 hypothetical protein DFO71_2694 [Bacillus licheniformis]TWJ37281.1 hypothetical protein CHCC5025_4648 [Bacillus licheniformis]TWJ89736.1 hypothetical protein CHCC20496_2662 [Bacillus licheniformis]